MSGNGPGEWFSLYRSLLSREIRSRFIGSATGWLWLIVTPLMLLGVYGFVFGVIFRARVPENFETPFVAWLAVAMWPWLAFSETVLKGSQAIVGNAALIGKVALPRELLVLSSASAVFILHMAGYLAVLLAIQWLAAGIHWLALPAALWVLLLVFVFAMGLSLLAAALQVFVRDLEHILPTVFLLWFFLTPILYSPRMLPEVIQGVFVWNPFYWVVERLRDIVLLGQWQFGLGDILMLAGSALTFLLGWWVFRRLSPHFEDFL